MTANGGGREGATGAPEERRAPRDAVEAVVAAGDATAAVALVATAEGPRRWVVAGEASGPGAVFDLASLTKPFVATLALALDRAGDLPLTTTVGSVLPDAGPAVRRRSLASLLRHHAGLAPWAPLYALCSDPAEAVARIAAGEWVGSAPDTYSDLGYILWTAAARRALAADPADLLGEAVLEPLGIAGEVTLRPGRERAVPCRIDTGRELELARGMGRAIELLGPPERGEPQDGNARFLGGLPGHAGLFGPAAAVAALGREWLEPGRVLAGRAVRRALAGGGRHALGWVRQAGRKADGPLGEGAIGHTGFTGGGVWLEPGSGRALVLLAHKARADVDLGEWRRRFLESVTMPP